ncbi:MAG: transposase [Planctomycetota bacterium]|jgi:transposase
MFTENFFTTLLNLEDGWVVESIKSNLTTADIFIHISCNLEQLVDDQTGDFARHMTVPQCVNGGI